MLALHSCCHVRLKAIGAFVREWSRAKTVTERSLGATGDRTFALSPVYTRPLTRIPIRIKVTRVGTCKRGYRNVREGRRGTERSRGNIREGRRGRERSLGNVREGRRGRERSRGNVREGRRGTERSRGNVREGRPSGPP